MSVEDKTSPETYQLDLKFPRPLFDVLDFLDYKTRRKEQAYKTRGEQQAYNEVYWIQVRQQAKAIEVEKDEAYGIWLDTVEDIQAHFPRCNSKELFKSWDARIAAVADVAFKSRPVKISPETWETALARAIRYGDELRIRIEMMLFVTSNYSQFING